MPHRMNVMSNWDQVKPVLKHQHPELTEDDLHYEEGKEDELYERISHRTRLGVEHTRAFIERLHSAL